MYSPRPFYDPFLGSQQRDTEFEEFRHTVIKTEDREDVRPSTTSTSPRRPAQLAMPNMSDYPVDDVDVDLSDEETGDRAEALVEEVAKEYQEGSGSEPIDEDTNLDFNAEETLDSVPDSHMLTPADSAQDDITTASERSTPSQTSRSVNGPEKLATKRKAKKYQSVSKKSKKRKADAPEPQEAAPAKRELRTRTPAQMTPFQADKVTHTMSKSHGQIPSKAEVEKQLRKAQPTTKATQTSKPRKSSKSLDIITSDISSAPSSSPEPIPVPRGEVIDGEYKRRHTTLRIAVDEVPDVGIEAPLAHFRTLGALFTFINNRWGRVKQRRVNHLTCERPWKGASSLAIFEGWDDQYKALEDSILEAPVWRKKSASPCALEVTIIVTLEKGGQVAP